MKEKFCSNCGTKLEKNSKFCPNCKKEIGGEKNFRKVGKIILDIIRYIFGIFFIYMGLFEEASLYSWLCCCEILLGLSLLPIIYRKIISKYLKNNAAIKYLQIILPIILVFCCGLLSNYYLADDDTSDVLDSSSEVVDTETTPKTEDLTQSQKMIASISGLIDEGLAFDIGSYVKGDIPAGEYAFIKFDGSGAYYSEEDAAGNIVDNENFDSFGYVHVHGVGDITTQGALVNVSAFARLGVVGAKQLYEIVNEQSNYSQSGYYKIGVDLPAGTYVLESIGSGYYAVMTGPVGSSEIVDNDNFNGRATVNVRNGQYLTLSRAQISNS